MTLPALARDGGGGSHGGGHRGGHLSGGHSRGGGHFRGHFGRGFHGGFHPRVYWGFGPYWAWPYYYPPDYYYPPPGYDSAPPPDYYNPPPGGVSQTPPAGNQPSFYPRQGQSPEKQAQDSNECQAWAMSQTGVDPTKPPPAGLSEAQLAQMSGEFYRAMDACMDARGYTLGTGR
jgi:hypothetical protein